MHEAMFDDADPLLARVRELAHALPGAQEKITHGHPAFFTKKVFAHYGGSLKIDGVYVQHPQSIVVQSAPDERDGLPALPGAYVPASLGPSGWTGIDLDDHTDWTEIAELLNDSFRVTAPPRLVAQL